MTLEECYRIIGGDLAAVAARLPSVQFAEKFLLKFPGDDSFDALCAAVRDGRRADAFRAAHTLKGVCQNLGLDMLLASASELTEALRPDTPDFAPTVPALFNQVAQDYTLTVDAIRAYQDGKQGAR